MSRQHGRGGEEGEEEEGERGQEGKLNGGWKHRLHSGVCRCARISSVKTHTTCVQFIICQLYLNITKVTLAE